MHAFEEAGAHVEEVTLGRSATSVSSATCGAGSSCRSTTTNYTGHPAASIPAGFAEGLPVGMQIIGPRLGDADVFAASAAFEQRRPWNDSYARCRERPLHAENA